jgi:hypothetical protein
MTTEEYATYMLAEHGPLCERLGYQANTDPWRLCIQLEEVKRASGGVAHPREHRL